MTSGVVSFTQNKEVVNMEYPNSIGSTTCTILKTT